MVPDGTELNPRRQTFGKIRFKLRPGLGDKGFFDTRAFEAGGAPFKAVYEKAGYVSFMSPIESVKSDANIMVENVFADK